VNDTTPTNELSIQRDREGRPLRFWRRFSLRKQMLYGFAIPVAIVLLASLFLARALDTLSQSANASIESTAGIGLRYALMNSVLDAETGLRGYLLSGDLEFLQPYLSAERNFNQISQRLESRDATRPAQQRNLREVETLFLRWRQEYAEPQIALRKATPVGESSQLWLLASLAAAPDAEILEHLPDYDRTLGKLHTSLSMLAPGPQADELNSVLALAGKARSAMPDADASSRAQLAAALRALAWRVQPSADQISSNIAKKRGKRLIDAIRALVQASLQEESIEQRTTAVIVRGDANRALWIALLVPTTALLIGLVLTLLVLVDAIRAIEATGRAATAVAGGDLQKRLKVLRRDELGQLGNAFNRMAEELTERNRRSMAINHFQTLLATSNSMDEIYAVVARLCIELFGGASGAVYRMSASRDQASRVAQWNWPDAANGRVLQSGDCRAVRTGKPYFASGETIETPCQHAQQLGVPVARSLCLPLSAHGEVFGILQLCRFGDSVPAPASARDIETAVLISEQLSMSLANLQLREQLRNQSIRDPLTGLFNRRYLEETMDRELARTARNGQTLAVIAIDVDHFKRFNDTHGHEAGDKVLVEFAGVLRRGIRSTDIACRYGGEEFVLLMPESPASIALERVEALRRQTSELRVHIGTVQLEAITISSGIAVAPTHGENGEMLLRNADTALYAAKAAGRDRTVVYHSD
jgi:diguanylate cyclase (GGDEF)-like protein